MTQPHNTFLDSPLDKRIKDPDAKYQIYVLFMHYGDNWLRGSEICLLNLMAHLPSPFVAVLWCNQPCLVEAAKQRGIPHAYCSPSMQLNWRNLQQAQQLCSDHPIMLIHANSAAPVKLASVIARQQQVPLLCHLHARYPWYQRWGFGLPWCSALAGVSQAVTAQLHYDGFSAQQVHLIHNGIDCQKLLNTKPKQGNLKHQLGLAPSDYLLVSVGSLIKRKGMDQLLCACAKLRLQGIPAHLAIIGSGPELDSLQAQTKQLNIASHVTFLGEQDNVVGLISGACDVFVSGAREEVFGLVLAEAGLAKLAVVAPDVGGISEVVEHQVTGLLYPDGDIPTLVKTLTLCYFAPKLRHQLGANGYLKARQHFDISHHCDRISQIYFQLLNQPNAKQAWHTHWPSSQQLWQAVNHIKQLLKTRIQCRITRLWRTA